MNIARIIDQNTNRKVNIRKPYNPLTGENCYGVRVMVEISDAPISRMWLPREMLPNLLVSNVVGAGSIEAFLLTIHVEPTAPAIASVWDQFEKVRIFYDFEYWAFRGVLIKDKNSENDIPFYLNRGQRKFLRFLLDDFWSGKPLRFILVKARQWGGSTLVQIFMAWIQLVHLRQWSSIIAAHVENTARLVQGMYSKLLSHYPIHWIDGFEPGKTKPLALEPYERATKTRVIKSRGCKVTIGSAEKPESIRGGDEAMAHLTEVASWKATDGKKPEDLVQSVISGIRPLPKTMIVYESTAKGVGNFFHREYLRAKKGKSRSAFTPIFISFFDIDDYSHDIPDVKDFIRSLTPQEWAYWEAGATLEAIAWRRVKRLEYDEEWRFISEYPGNDVEAFQSTGHRFYPIQDVERLRRGCLPEPLFVGDVYGKSPSGADALKELSFKEEQHGRLKVWAMPGEERCTDRYVAVMDIGGRSDHSDNSVIAVFDRLQMMQGGVPEVVAEWCGHIDHDLLAWKGAQISTAYHNALLVIESNTYETENTEGDHFEYILDEIAREYDNLFSRTPSDKRRQGHPARWGWHTNRSSKQMACDHQKKALREDMYIENSPECCDEHDTLEVKANGSIGAVDGCHDDRHITRAIGVWVCYQYLSAPKAISAQRTTPTRRIQNESSF